MHCIGAGKSAAVAGNGGEACAGREHIPGDILDVDVNYAKKVEKLFADFLEAESQMITSTITCTEYLIYPYRTGNSEKIDAFYEFLSDCHIPMCPIDVDIAKKAAQISNYTSLRK